MGRVKRLVALGEAGEGIAEVSLLQSVQVEARLVEEQDRVLMLVLRLREEDNEERRQWRISSWKERRAPEGYAFPGDPRGWEQDKYDTAELTPLGKKLLGLDRW